MGWYVRYRLRSADVVVWFAERSLVVDWSAICRWVQRFLPRFQDAARPYAVGAKWRVDEPYTRLQGKWTYIECAKDGHVVDAYVAERPSDRRVSNIIASFALLSAFLLIVVALVAATWIG